MIPATVRWYARFTSKLTDKAGNETTYSDFKRILAWDEDGRALIAPDKGGTLVPAAQFRNFVDLCESANYSPLVALLPAGGWRIEMTGDHGTWDEPLLGWGLREDGDVVPLSTDSTGYVLEGTDTMSEKVRIYHPEAAEATPPGSAAS